MSFGREHGQVASMSQAATHSCNLSKLKAFLKICYCYLGYEVVIFLMFLDPVATGELSWRW